MSSEIKVSNGLTFTYDGGEKIPVLNYDKEKVEASGTLFAVKAGIYQITLSLKNKKSSWDDGTTEPKIIPWKINKAENTIVLSKTSGTVAYGSSISFVVNTNISGGEISVKTNDTEYAEILRADNIITVRCIKHNPNKPVIVTVTSAETANFLASEAQFTMKTKKAEGYIELDKNAAILAYNAAEEFTVTKNRSGGSLSVTTDSEGYVTTEINQNRITAKCVRCKDLPSTIVVTSAETANYEAASVAFTVSSRKLDGYITLSTNKLSLHASEPVETFTVNRLGTGRITVTTNNLEVAEVSGEELVTVTGVGNGNAVITVSVDADDNYTAASTNVEVSVTWWKVMTVKIDQNNSNPETCCTYADDATSMTAGSSAWGWFIRLGRLVRRVPSDVIKRC